jgi:MYXO-CTERM domain-containing protein
VNDLIDAGTVAAQMDIDVTADTTTTPTGGGSNGSISLAGLFALMLIGVARRLRR